MWKPIERWRRVGRARMELDYLLAHANDQAALLERVDWLVEVFRWMQVPGSLAVQAASYESGQMQATRVRYLLLVLDRNVEWKRSVAKTLRSILRDTNALDLFCVTGLPSEAGFISEAADRVMEKILPRPPHEKDLSELFARLFSSEKDIRWLERLDSNVLEEIWQLFSFEETADDLMTWAKLRADMEDALIFLAGQVRAFGLAPKLRARMNPEARLRDLPFFEVTFLAQLLLRGIQRNDVDNLPELAERFRSVLSACRVQIKTAYEHLDEFGVSIAIVYQLERIELLIRRIETLLAIILGKTNDPQNFVRFLCSLILESHQRKSITSLFTENLSLISMKIAERSAEAGDHYITRTSKEYAAMFRKAAGGGALTSLTALFKMIIEGLRASFFVTGIAASLNYSLSFLVIYGLGYTLATKQPAMTANALAAKMNTLDSEASRDSLVDEIVNLIRSQGAAILGNLALVIPCSIIIESALYFVRSAPLMREQHAIEILEKHSIFGFSIVHAAFTGILLWFSSIIAGWIDNWSVYRELPQAFGSSRTLKTFLGPTRLSRWVGTYQRHLAGWTGNISLGFLLGMAPHVFGFFGLPLDVRHVTLSTSVISYASSSLGLKVLSMPAFWTAVAGVVAIGVMNVGVSFFLALFVALKARRIRAPIRDEIYGRVATRFRKKPLSFFLAPSSRSGGSSH